jgi:hypothetical protein
MPRSGDGCRVLRAEVVRELRSLGTNKDEVAHRLEAAGVQGAPGKVAECAIAVYLSAVVAADARVQRVVVSSERVFLRVRRWWWPWTGVGLPKALRQFVVDFDHRRYPELIRPRAAVDRSSLGATH